MQGNFQKGFARLLLDCPRLYCTSFHEIFLIGLFSRLLRIKCLLQSKWVVLGFICASFHEMFLIGLFSYLIFCIWFFLYYIIFTKKMRDYSLFDDLILLVQSLPGYGLFVQSVSLCCLLRKSDRFFLSKSVSFYLPTCQYMIGWKFDRFWQTKSVAR